MNNCRYSCIIYNNQQIYHVINQWKPDDDQKTLGRKVSIKILRKNTDFFKRQTGILIFNLGTKIHQLIRLCNRLFFTQEK